MKHIVILVGLLLLPAHLLAEPPEAEVVRTLTSVITNLCPKAHIETDRLIFSAKFSTMVYTMHSSLKTGEVSKQTYQQEGPGFEGFTLGVSLEDGKYAGAADVPQTVQGPYFPTFLDAPATDGGKKHYLVQFSYGTRLNPALKKAIFEAIPKSRLQQSPEDTLPILTNHLDRSFSTKVKESTEMLKAAAPDQTVPNYLKGEQMSSMLLLELSNMHTKRCYRSSDGKIFLAYSELKYEAATGKTHWQQTLYWTWDKDFPEWCRDTLNLMSDAASQAPTNSVIQPAR